MLALLLTTAAYAGDTVITHNPEGIGLGLILGAPTGFSFGWRPGGRFMADAGIAWSFSDSYDGLDSWAQVHADVCIDLADLRTADLPDMHFPVWIGVGPRARFGSGTGYEAFNLAARVPIAMGFWHNEVPIEGFLEVAPGVGLFPRTEFTFDASIGARFWLAAPGGTARFTAPEPMDDRPY